MSQKSQLTQYYNARIAQKLYSIPLTSHATDDLQDYLIAINSILHEHGIKHPKSIMADFEQNLFQELSDLKHLHKIDRSDINQLKIKLGDPRQVVNQLLMETKPEKLLYPENLRNQNYTTFKLFVKKIHLPVFYSIMILEIAYIVTLPQISRQNQFFFFPLIVIFVPYIVIEIGHGIITKTSFTFHHYHRNREIIRFLLTMIFIEISLALIDLADLRPGIIRNREIVINWIAIFLVWFLVYFVGIIKDRTEILQTSNISIKPIVRFILPSYLILISAYIVTSFGLFYNFDQPPIYSTTKPLITISIILAILSIFADYRRKYPFSLKKLGYAIFLAVISPLLVFSYGCENAQSMISLCLVWSDVILYTGVAFLGIVGALTSIKIRNW